MKLKVVSKGAQAQNIDEHIEVSDATFAREYNEALVHQVVVAYRNAGRAGTKAQKTKAEVRGGGIKPWRQKGTGQARAGSIRSPIWVGGGRAFAAKPRDFAQKVNRKMYRGAMQAMLSELARTDRLSVVNGIELEAPKTKLLLQKLGELKLGSNVLIVIEAHDEKLELAARNLPYIDVLPVSSLDPLSLARHDHVLATAGAVRQLEERLA
jgi:large subunit ribosomal protein L4